MEIGTSTLLSCFHYKLAEDARSDASQFCDFHLSTVIGADDQKFLEELFASLPAANRWVGAFQDPPDEPIADAGWAWVTDEPFVFTNWNPSDGFEGVEPNDLFGPGSEQHMLVNAQGLWNDEAFLGNLGGYIVENVAPIPIPASFGMIFVSGGIFCGFPAWKRSGRPRSLHRTSRRTGALG